MKQSIAMKIISKNSLSGQPVTGEDIDIKIQQALTQDSTGTMVYLQLEALGVEEIKADTVAYIDHNTIQSGFENADDHEFIKSVAEKYGITYSKPGGGICHQVQLEKFAKPGNVLIGSDSHTPTAGGIGSLAIGAGGLDVAVGMAFGKYRITVPKVRNVVLEGELKPGVNGKDVILEILRRLSVKGGVGYIIEYSGPGVKALSVTDRATICNMGAELGATTSIFPSDENTRDFLKRQGREEDYIHLEADEGAFYDDKITINLSEIDPLVAKPHSPDNVVEVDEVEGLKIDQVCIGSCTNSSYTDLMKAARILEGQQVHPDVSLVIAPGSATVLNLLIENGALSTFIQAGARIIESACGPCIGMGMSPKSGAVSLRTFNRNFQGRSGTFDADIYLVSPETAAASAVSGVMTNPMGLDVDYNVEEPESYHGPEHYFIYNEGAKPETEIIKGPNIKEFPLADELGNELEGVVLLKAADNVTTDDIVPSHARLLPFRSNVPYLAGFAFGTLIEDFKGRAEEYGGGFIVAGDNYGQGSSREHAALVPLYLGVKGVVAKTFARIHKTNLINNGIIPFQFENPEDYDKINELDQIVIENLDQALKNKKAIIETKTGEIPVKIDISDREGEILKSGGYLKYVVKEES